MKTRRSISAFVSLFFIALLVLTAILITAPVANAESDTEPTPAPANRGARHAAPENDGDEDVSIADERPNVISVELLGRAALYSINYDRSLSQRWSLGIGYSSISLSASADDNYGDSTSVSANVTIIPIYVNYYLFGFDSNRGFLTGGIDFISGSADSDGIHSSGSGANVVLGAGYEFRAHTGFLFRFTPYLISGDGHLNFWFGTSLGYAF